MEKAKRFQSLSIKNIFKVLDMAKRDLETINYVLPDVKFKSNEDCQLFMSKLDEVIEQLDNLSNMDIEEVDPFEDNI